MFTFAAKIFKDYDTGYKKQTRGQRSRNRQRATGQTVAYSRNVIRNGGLKFIKYIDKKIIAVTCPSWFTDERPAEIEKFWGDAGCKLDTIGHNVLIMQKASYVPVAVFALPEKCWTDNYFIPREAALKALSDKYDGNKTVEAFIENNRYEVELYSKYKQYYGYVFYIGKKV
ncbi:MAG: hypothetical protein LBF08_02125 [Dysgonamonadaceae bacterium]|nr:hypothetical protein [Dysgonamonadaceae bacterium]